MSDVKAPYVAGFFSDPKVWTKAVEASTARGHRDHDGFMPYPIHGFDASFGYKRSWLGRLVLFMLLSGAVAGFFTQWYLMKMDWPIIIAGKPYNSWPAYVVITFEAGILSGALTNMFACLFLACKLVPRPFVHVIKEELTDDMFALCIPVNGNGSPEDIKNFLSEQGAEDIALYALEDEAEGEVEHA
ncbi:MAG: DUF3341 domain-containing protein [Planctomycetota bacterium]|jgi:hypothetical protein|nr:DUF3341 domain-containing protein [Planctomycetota bacterium]